MNKTFARLGRDMCAPLFLAAAFLAAAGLAISVASAASFAPPAIGGPGPAEHHPGKMVWADLVTPDLGSSERFYAGLFGWTFQPVATGSAKYAVAAVDGRPVAGLFEKPLPSGERRQPMWLTFLAVGDVDAAEKVAQAQGAKAAAPPKTFAPRGRQAVLSDPEGAVFALLASSTGDAADELAEPGEWIWSVLFEQSPEKAASFYKAVLGYEIFDMPAGEDGATHVILSSDDYARAGIHTLPPYGRRRAHWLNFVRVVNAADAAAKAVALGGRVLEEPYMDRHGGRIAVIADPLGVPVGLMEWVEGDTQMEPK